MNFIKDNLANALTLGNLFSGCIGAINLIHGDYRTTAVCISISLILDFFDGFVARALKSNSNLGVQLDSLADMVSFGLVPGLAMYQMISEAEAEGADYIWPYLKYAGLFITLFSCLRLAIFNLDEEQKYYFKGLNTPSNTILIFGLYFAYREGGHFSMITSNPLILLLLTLVSSWLLIAPIKMISLKFKSKLLKDNYSKLALLIGAVAILFIFKTAGIPLIIVYYIFISLIFQKELK